MKYLKIVSICIIVFNILFSVQIYPQEKLFGRKGIGEISGSVSFSSYTSVNNGSSGSAVTIMTFAPQIGLFAADGLEFSFRTGISIMPGWLPGVSMVSSDGGSSTIVGFFFAPSYNFSTEKEILFPFIEGEAGYTSAGSGSNTNSGFSYGARAGVKIVASGNLLIIPSVEYLCLNLSSSGATKRSGYNYFSVGVGIAGFF